MTCHGSAYRLTPTTKPRSRFDNLREIQSGRQVLTAKSSSTSRCWRVTMPQRTRIAPLLFLVLLIAACSQQPSQLETIAHQLSAAASRCVTDVRDRGVKYENPENCRSLGKIAQQYISAGGLKDSAPSRVDRIAESARARAWMALAISKTGDPRLSIW